jgi:hypothetical protein
VTKGRVIWRKSQFTKKRPAQGSGSTIVQLRSIPYSSVLAVVMNVLWNRFFVVLVRAILNAL